MTQKEERLLRDTIEKADLFGLTIEVALCIIKEIVVNRETITQACRIALDEWDVE